MSEELSIEFEWLDLEAGSEIDRAFAASIGLAVGDEYVTRIDDLGAKTVRDQMRGSAWHLAAWFAANWWRLRWEPAPSAWWEDTDWRLAHSMAGAGGGYVWPNAIFTSDGESVEIAARPKAKSPRFEPIRYINEVQAHVSAVEFEKKVDGFMASVLSRLDSLEVRDRSLVALWKEVLAERRNPKARMRRKLEAMAGYDPDEAPDELLKQLIQDKERLGKSALEEVAAEARHKTGDFMKFVLELVRSNTEPRTAGFRGSLPDLNLTPAIAGHHGAPWERASKLARAAREQWGFGNKPILNKALARLLKTSPAVFTDRSKGEVPMPLALRAGSNGTFDIYFDSAIPTTRRFTVSRLIGGYLDSAHRERLLPATHAKTSRQKFQRAFAQEFLCPIDRLLEKMQTSRPDEDDIEAAATYFHVSPLMVRTTLVNHNKLEREALSWNDGPRTSRTIPS